MPIIYDPPAGADTFGGIIDEVLTHLYGFTTQTDRTTFLTTVMGSVDLSLTVDDANDVGKGIIEIDSELLLVTSVDKVAKTVKLLPKGRGYRSTTVTPHDVNSTVTISPTVPRSAVMRAITNEVNGLFPTLFAVDTYSFTPNGVTYAYGIPANALQILDVQFYDQIEWSRVRHWEVESTADILKYPTGRVLRIMSPNGWAVRVVYAKRPVLTGAESAPYSDTGYPPSTKDVIVLGALLRLTPSMDMGRLAVQSVASQELDQGRPLGGASIITREIKAQYTARLALEQLALARQYPCRVHITR